MFFMALAVVFFVLVCQRKLAVRSQELATLREERALASHQLDEAINVSLYELSQQLNTQAQRGLLTRLTERLEFIRNIFS